MGFKSQLFDLWPYGMSPERRLGVLSVSDGWFHTRHEPGYPVFPIERAAAYEAAGIIWFGAFFLRKKK